MFSSQKTGTPGAGTANDRTTLAAMGSWYWIGVAAGIGTAAGMAIATLVPVGRAGVGLAALLGAGAGLGLGLLVGGWIAAAAGAVGGALGALSTVPVIVAAIRGGGTRLGVAAWILGAGGAGRGARVRPGPRLRGGGGRAAARAPPAQAHDGPLRGPAHPRERLMAKGVVLVVIDGLTPSVFERAETPALTFLREHGIYRRAVSTFPSLTPVCASSIATGSHPDVHHIPHLVWFDREDRRLVEYGSSFAAVVAAGTRRSLVDTIFNMNAKHLGPAPTVFEALDDAGLRTAAVNFTCYRGRTEHRSTFPGVTRTVRGPQRFFFYNVFQSDVTGAPLSFRNRDSGTIDDYAAAVGRWLVTRGCFDFFLFYLSDYDYASHSLGPEGAAANSRTPTGRSPASSTPPAGLTSSSTATT